MKSAARRLDGEVILARSVTGTAVTALAGSLVLGAIFAASIIPINTRQTARGWTVPTGGQIMVTAQAAGVVDGVLVRQNQVVERGTPLLRIAPPENRTGASLARSLDQESSAARLQASALDRELRESRATLERQIAATDEELAGLSARAVIQSERSQLAQQALARSETLAARGFLPARELELRRAALIEARDAEILIQIETGRARNTRRDLQDRLRRLPTERAKLDAATAIDRAGVDQRRIEAERRIAQIHRAPITGEVATLAVRLGQPVRAGDAVAVMVPPGSVLETELQIPASAIGRIKVGQSLALRYDAYPFQRFGSVRARITSISSGVLPPSASTIPGITPAQPYYLATAAFVDGTRIADSSGLLVTAEIVTDNRTMMARFFDALRSAKRVAG